MLYENDAKEQLHLIELDKTNSSAVFAIGETDRTLLWNTGALLHLTIDKVPYQLVENQVLFLTEFHKVDSIDLTSARMIRFNQPFFCIINHDDEVGSKGLLFFGASGIPVISIPDSELHDFDTCWQILVSEIRRNDMLQKEMLQSMLKRMLILSVRVLRRSSNLYKLEKSQADIIREFNFLVESHFVQHHDVAFYAEKLNKSPKTLSNLFAIVSQRPPLNIIHDRIMVHARRQITYTSLSVKEIAYALGFTDVQTFSRFFKNKEGISPIQYREKFEQLQLQ